MSKEKENVIERLIEIKESIGQFSGSTIEAWIDDTIKLIKLNWRG